MRGARPGLRGRVPQRVGDTRSSSRSRLTRATITACTRFRPRSSTRSATASRSAEPWRSRVAVGERISGLTVDGKELHAAVFNENEVRAAAGLTMVIGAVAFATPTSLSNTCRSRSSTTLFFVEFLIRLTVRDPVQPDRRRRPRDDAPATPPEWVSAKPKRFAWTLGLGMSFSMMVITNSGIRGTLPRTICLICLTLMWMESVLGVCLGCKIHGLLVRRGWTTKDPDFEVCAHGACELPARERSRHERRSSVVPPRRSASIPAGQAQAEAAFLDAQPGLPRDGRPRRAARLRVRRASTPAATSISTTPAAACTRPRSSRSTCACCARPSTATRTRSIPTSSAATVLVEQARAAVLRYFNAPESEYACIFTPNATGALRLVGEAYPFGPQDRVPGDVRQPQLGQRHPRVRPREGRADGLRAARGARPARRRRAARALPRRRRRRTATTSSPTRRSRTSPASSTRSSGSRAAQERGWDVIVDAAAFVPTSRLDLSRLEAGLRPDLVLQDVRLPDRPRRAARPARRRSRGCSARGSAAAPSSPRTSRASWSCRCPATRCSRTARSTTSASRRSRSACATSSGSASTRSRGACEALGTWLLEALQRPAPLRRQPGDARLRADDLGPPRRHDRVQLPAPGRPRGRRALRRRRRGGPQHLRADRLLLQLGRRRDRVLDLARHADRRRVRRRDDPRRLHPARRHAHGRRGAGLARARHELRGRLPLHALRDGVPRRHRGARRTCRPGSPARRSPPAGRAGAAPGAAPP